MFKKEYAVYRADGVLIIRCLLRRDAIKMAKKWRGFWRYEPATEETDKKSLDTK